MSLLTIYLIGLAVCTLCMPVYFGYVGEQISDDDIPLFIFFLFIWPLTATGAVIVLTIGGLHEFGKWLSRRTKGNEQNRA